VQDRIRWFDTLAFMDRKGQVSTLRGSRLPAPFHLLPSFFRTRFLTRADKLGIARALMSLLRPPDEALGQSITAMEWLRRTGQTPGAIERFWRVILVSALNEEPERCAASYAWQIFRLGFLAHPQAYQMGVPAVPLRDLYEPCVADIRRRGGEVHYRQVARALQTDAAGQVTGVRMADGSVVPADYVVSALPFDALPELLPEGYRSDPFFSGFPQMENSPISAVHLWYDREITRLDHAVLLDRPVQWMFNKTRNYARAGDQGSYLGLVVSASRDWIRRSRREILEVAEREVREAFPGAAGAKILKSAVIKEAKATFSASPGIDRLRPPAETPLKGLYLAGDWTRTGWPATMEGAVRSGYLAAERILADVGQPANVVRADLPWQSVLGRA
jgi:squalene-associated FAD-dependent desaturase